MAITTQEIDLCITPSVQIMPEVYASQYDDGIRRVHFTIYQDEDLTQPMSLSGLTASVEGTKPDGKGFAYPASISGSTVTVLIQMQMTAVAGIVPSEIVLRDGEARIGSVNFLLMVEPAGLAEDVDISETVLPTYINGAQQAAREAAASAEEAAQTVQQAQASATAAAESAAEAAESGEDAEAWANGERGGVPVSEGDPAYHNNAKYWKEQAETAIVPIERGGTGNTVGYIQTGALPGSTIGVKATAEGGNNTASGNFSHAEGSSNIASESFSHAEGQQTTASGVGSHAEGIGGTASGICSHAGGNAVDAEGHSSFVHGRKFTKNLGGTNRACVFGFYPDSVSYSVNQTVTCINGASGVLKETAKISVRLNSPGAMFLLLCASHVTETGETYGAATALIVRGLTSSVPVLLPIAQTANAPATIAAAANNTITIQNDDATRETQFNLIRLS